MIYRSTFALVLLLVLAGACAADEPKAFACSFTEGTTHAYEKGEFAVEQTAPLAFVIGAIDADAQTADMKNERGTGTLRIVRAVNAMHFLEVVTEGFLHITTVYDKDETRGAHPAVHSRHFGLFGQPIVTQYQGFCEALG
ncbi:MAG: hypothetical protein F9K29_24670 [Hyphomicrobiaceae bacterium]|nr:MAG: hypothetical protein F9K29_24670 [Hyphomicrobiaceae bacterium]